MAKPTTAANGAHRPARRASGRAAGKGSVAPSEDAGPVASAALPANAVRQIDLVFSDWKPIRHVEDPLHKDLSAVARIGDSLFVACDETASVERLRRMSDDRFGDHQHFTLDGLVDLPAGAAGEMDIEGLCIDSGFLWIAGSHSLKRSKPKREQHEAGPAMARMEEIEREANRYFLGRVPLVEEGPGIYRPMRSDQSSWVGFGKKKSKLMQWLADDPLLEPFLDIPSKENGFDIEGLAALGDRAWVGLRGPVLRGHAVILDFEFKLTSPDRLKGRKIDGKRRYRKHLLDTRGLGIRDMRRDNDDLLLLVGPTMSLEGAAFVLRWRDGTRDDSSGVIDPKRLEHVTDLPYKHNVDHPEGLELWPQDGPDALFVLYDAPAPERLDPDNYTVRADIVRPIPAGAGK